MSTVSGMSDVPSQHDGWDLHLAPGTVSGFPGDEAEPRYDTRR